jgi:hypothetical protein
MAGERKTDGGWFWPTVVGLCAVIAGGYLLEQALRRTAPCPQCRKAVDIGAAECPHCKARLEWRTVNP